MDKKGVKKEKKYMYVVVTQCMKCHFKVDEPGPCSKCKNESFVRVLEIKEKG